MPWRPTEAMANNARRALKWRDDGFKGGAATGVRRARQLVARRMLSPQDVIEMNAWFARHSKSASPNEKRSNSDPSPWWVAWNLWGGDSAKRFVEARVDSARRDREKQRAADTNTALAEIELAQWAADAHAIDALHRSVETGALAWVNRDEMHAGEPELYTVRNGAAVHNVTGILVSAGSPLAQMLGLTDYETLGRAIRAAESDASVDEHLFVIDSPGGDTAGLPDLIQTMGGAEKRKRAYVRGRAQSAGYWIASHAGEIAASETAIIGCLGVVRESVEPRDDDRAPFKITCTVSSQTPGKMGTDSSNQRLVDDLAGFMLGSIATARNLTVDALLSATGDGEDAGASVSARRALAGGLIDRIATMTDVMGADEPAAPTPFRAVDDGMTVAAVATDSITTAPPVAHNTREANMADTDNRHGDNVVDAARLTAAQERVAELEAALKGAAVTIDGERVTAAALLSQLNETKATAAAAAEAVAKAEAEAESLRAAAFDADVSAALEAAHKVGKLGPGEKEHLAACASEDAEVYGRDKALARLKRGLDAKAAVVPVGPAAGHDEPAEVSFADRANALAAEKGITYAAAAKMLRHGEVK